MNPVDLLKEPTSENLLWKIVEILLATDQPTILTQAIFVIATVLLSTAIFKISYLVISGIITASNKGSKFTDSINVVLAPLSIIFGIGIMMPIPGGSGITAAHYVIRNLIVAPSINMFDGMSLLAAEHVIKDGKPLYPLAMHGTELAYAVFGYDLCNEVYNQHVDNMRSPDYEYLSKPADGGEVVELENGTKKSVWNWTPTCGSITLSYPLADEFGLFGHDRHKALTKLVSDVRSEMAGFGNNIITVLQRHREATDFKSAEALVKNQILPADLLTKFESIGKEYEEALQAAASKQLNISQGEQRKKLIDEIKRSGGAVMFSYYTSLTRMNEQANGFTTEAPVFKAPNPEDWGAMSGDLNKNFRLLVESLLKREAEEKRLTGDDFAFATEQDTTLFAKVVNKVSGPIIDYLTRYDGWTNDPTTDLMNLGSNMMTSAKIGFGVGLAATGASNFWSSTAGKVVDYIMTGVWPLLAALYVGGATLAIVLPNLPMIYAMFGIAAFAVELLVVSGAILWWGFTHARLDNSDSFVSTANMPGYKFLFSLMFRMPMNMLAFLGAILLNAVLLNIFLFLGSFGIRANLGGATLGITSIIFSVAIMTYVQYKIVQFVYSLNMTLHERISAWFGHVTQGMGEGGAANTIIATSSQNMSMGSNHKPNSGPGKTDKGQKDTGNNGGGRSRQVPIPEKRNSTD